MTDTTIEKYLTVWGASVPAAGAFSQVKGVCAALDSRWTHLEVGLSSPFRYFPTSFFGYLPASAFDMNHDYLDILPPDVLVTCGRKSIAFSLKMKRKYQDSLITVHVQNPVISSSNFDLVIAPRHDRVKGENVIETNGAIHSIGEDILNSKKKNTSFCSQLSNKWVTLLIGGESSQHTFKTRDINNIVSVVQVLLSSGSRVVMLPSRRTPQHTVDKLFELSKKNPTSTLCWNRIGPSPYAEALSGSSHILVTEDSISMISEACSTGKPVMILPISKKRKSVRFDRFFSTIYEKDVARKWSGSLETWSAKPLNDLKNVTEKIRNYITNKRSV